MGRFINGIRKFMYGRYGFDQLGRLILILGFVINIASMFVNYPPVKLALTVAASLLLTLAIIRILSRKTWKRFDENKKYAAFLARIKDRDHRYYRCPKCRQKVRVPKGKGKISISCPKCKEKFVRKT